MTNWNNLARKNSHYYIYSNEGENIDAESFRRSGERDVQELVLDDVLLKAHLQPFKEKTMVEIGCGIGRLTEFLIPHFKRVYGFDISSEMIQQGKQRLPEAFLISTDGQSIPLENESVDFVFSFITFQHMPNKKIVKRNMSEIERVLKVGGGVAKIQFRGTPTKRFQWYSGISFSEKDLLKLAQGLKIINVEGVGQKYMWVWFQK